MNAHRSRILVALDCVAAAILGVLLAAAPASAGTPAATATDICASNANPCNVTKVYDIAPNSVLDFGNRTVAVSGSGQFNFDVNSGRIQCGSLTASTSAAFLNAAGALASGTGSGSVLVLARRQCSTSAVPCLDDADCQLGPCGVQRCSLKSTRTCTSDTDCQLGNCTSFRRCANASTVRCSTNSDCDFGTCPAALSCTGRGDDPVACTTNADCAFGSCSVGTASVTMDGAIAGSSDNPATIVVRAADSISISKTVNLNGTSIDADGGSLSLDARAGSVTITNKINATGGTASGGGSVELSAGTDVSVQDDITVTGGDFDGGSADFTAGRDVILHGSVVANSVAGAGFGGDVTATAGRDVSFTGISPSNKKTIEMSGHTDVDNFAGDGGSLDVFASRNLSFDANTRVLGNGSAPDATGADVSVESGSALTMSGDMVAKGVGGSGTGGYVTVIVDGGALGIASTGTFDVTGGSGGGGDFEADSNTGDITFAGDADVSGATGGAAGTATLYGKQAATVTGTLFANGTSGGILEVEACRVRMASGGNLDINSSGGRNSLISHDTTNVDSGSSMTAPADGSNTMRYRNAARPPVVQGNVTPAPTLVVDSTLSDCPLCGNRIIDAGESCDDGNQVSGDGCNAQCQNEKCIQQTVAPGYPTVGLCEDGDPCTTDACNPAQAGGTCVHSPKTCDDSIACTVDTCDATDGTCRHSPSDALCDDRNVCTDDFCSATSGCANTANSSACDDGNRCTANDICTNKVCKGTRINGCLFCGDEFVNYFGGEQCDDGNNVDGDCCSHDCKLEAASSPCEDGLFCTSGDACDGAGTCVSGPPTDCADADPCTQDSCDEEIVSCVHAGTPLDAGQCLVAPLTKLLVKNSPNAKRDKLSWRWGRGDGFPASELGTPNTDTHYTLCVYDKTASTSSLKASIDVAPSATLWNTDDPTFLQYKDKAGGSHGVRTMQLHAGDAGSTDVRVGAGGTNLLLPSAAGSTFFHEDPSVVVQLRNGAGTCWTSEFAVADTKANGAAVFKAGTK